MQSDIYKAFEFLLELNVEYNGELDITLDTKSNVIKIVGSNDSEYCFYFSDKLVYLKVDEEIVLDSLDEFVKYVRNEN